MTGDFFNSKNGNDKADVFLFLESINNLKVNSLFCSLLQTFINI